MSRKYLIIIVIILIGLCGIFILDYSTGAVQGVIFDQIPYNYTSDVWLPPTSPESGSIAGYYSIYGQGKNFNFKVNLPGAQFFDLHEINGTQICYDEKGLSGQGHLNFIKINYNTVSALLSNDLKRAMFSTEFSGNYTMKCAAWNGNGNFSNNGQNFSGTFIIIGPATDWVGNFTLAEENNRIKIISSYIYYPHAQKTSGNIRKVNNNIFYM
ncbi:MAG: hypothetical protein Q7U35_07230 [Methanobacteriaceae archaeon]|jgi:hypothetical protein|nr:hypothetical protein [Methanobacteriaceae archaeon]MDP2836384.1 hypothetical protein [Methanobacteriaceae archaeon]PKL66523.1 MAG: hypothetical protein CVV28_10280 [Methanobacteriales archaeon HGW-Methanobacteriales-1]